MSHRASWRRRVACAAGAITLLGLLAGCGPRPHVPIRHVAAPQPKNRVSDDGAQSLVVPSLPMSAESPSFSPDGKTILFTQYTDGYQQGDSSLLTVASGGGTPTALAPDPNSNLYTDNGGAWSTRTGRIAFVGVQGSGEDNVFTMAADGTDIRQVTHRDMPEVFSNPSISPDGEWVVFVVQPLLNAANPDSGLDVGFLEKARIDGGEVTQLTRGPADGTDDDFPQWSPDAQRILFQRRDDKDSVGQLYTMAADGSDITQVTTDEADHNSPAWSPDGRWVAYSSDAGTDDSLNIYAIRAAGGTRVEITRNTAYDSLTPAWSPDGKTIVFGSAPAHTDKPSSLWTIATPPAVTAG